MTGNQGFIGWSQPVLAPVIMQRRTSTPTTGATVTGDSAFHQWSTTWTITVTNVGAGQRVMLRCTAALQNSSNYGYIGLYRVTGGPTFLAAGGNDMNGHVRLVSLDYADLTPGLGSVTYEIYGAGNTGTVTLRNNASSTFSLDMGTSQLVADVYNPPTS